jgi:hypothetical protein
MNKSLYLAIFLIVIIIGIATLIAALFKQSTTTVPTTISSEVDFTILYPAPHINGLHPQSSTITYSQTNKGLSYVVLVDNKKVVVSEQSTPDIFSQNGVYNYKLSQAHEYNSFNTSAGEVALTRPNGLGGQSVAWVNAGGTLTLARAYQSLNEDQWKLLFNNMETAH